MGDYRRRERARWTEIDIEKERDRERRSWQRALHAFSREPFLLFVTECDGLVVWGYRNAPSRHATPSAVRYVTRVLTPERD